MKIGFLINPIAGLGGTVALKGTDNLANEAIKLGAKPVSPIKAEIFLENLFSLSDSELLTNILFLVPEDPMGSQIVSKFKFKYEIIPLNNKSKKTTAEDTKNIIKYLEKVNVDLIIFVGGDGTSIDIGTTIQKDTPILGIPSGVKTYGSVFSHSPEEGVSILQSFYKNKVTITAELLDLDEKLYKKGVISIALRGLASIPAYPNYFQQAKERIESTDSERMDLESIADEILDQIRANEDKLLLIIGPGSTFSPFAEKIQVSRSILGVDCVEFHDSKSFLMIKRDATENDIFNLLPKYNAIFLLLTPIGGMGYILGRGNHQISPRILRKIPKGNILIACSQRKLSTIKDKSLRIDTIDRNFNLSMEGFIRVIIGLGEFEMVKVTH